MRIDGLGTSGQPSPLSGGLGAVSNAPTNGSNSVASLANEALQQQQQGGGGGGHGGGHGVKKTALDAIDDIAARAAVRIQPRGRSIIDRQAEIDELQAELEAESETVGEKSPDERDEHGRPRDSGDEEPAPE